MPSNVVTVVEPSEADPTVRVTLESVEATIEAQTHELLGVLALELPASLRTRVKDEVLELRTSVLRLRSMARAIGGGL